MIIDEDAHVEIFATAMGQGIGVIQIQVLGRPAGLPVAVDAPAAEMTTGLSLAISASPEGGAGLLVVGTCVNPEQTHAMAGIVGLIAGGSRLVPLS